MIASNRILFVAVAAAVQVGCATQLTYSLRRTSSLTDAQLREVRYHVGCEDIRLVGDVDVASGTDVDASHAINVHSGRRTDIVDIPDGTLGKVVEAGPNWVKIKFEKGERFLVFAAPTGDAYPRRSARAFDDPRMTVVAGNPSDSYHLVAEDWSREPSVKPGGGRHDGWHGTIAYGKDRYDAGRRELRDVPHRRRDIFAKARKDQARGQRPRRDRGRCHSRRAASTHASRPTITRALQPLSA